MAPLLRLAPAETRASAERGNSVLSGFNVSPLQGNAAEQRHLLQKRDFLMAFAANWPQRISNPK